MTFEEFFQKKRIDLTKLQAGEPTLFFEFKNHFEQMGEKSFDHTKKYWFNKLRLSYHLSPEQKPEKMHLENRLAEQTIIETLTASIPVPSPKIGFKPRFNSGVANSDNEIPEAMVPDVPTESPVETAAPKPAFKPRFNPGMVSPKPAEEAVSEKPKAESTEMVEPTAAKPAGFKPRFNSKMMAPKPAEEAESTAQKAESAEIQTESLSTEETTAPKPAFKPRFNMKVTPKLAEEKQPTTEVAAPIVETPAEPASETPAASQAPAGDIIPKPVGFKPRFNAAKMKPKPPQDN